jgi:hypothetical protein
MKDPCVTCYGLTLMTEADGGSLLEVLAIPLELTFQTSSFRKMD